jgi:hypothetical protein
MYLEIKLTSSVCVHAQCIQGGIQESSWLQVTCPFSSCIDPLRTSYFYSLIKLRMLRQWIPSSNRSICRVTDPHSLHQQHLAADLFSTEKRDGGSNHQKPKISLTGSSVL